MVAERRAYGLKQLSPLIAKGFPFAIRFGGYRNAGGKGRKISLRLADISCKGRCPLVGQFIVINQLLSSLTFVL